MVKIYSAKAPWSFIKGLIRDVRPTWVCEELGLPYERIVLDPTKGETRSPEYLEINPFGKIPSLVDGSFKLSQSAAICEYLADKAGALIPKIGTPERAKHSQWMYMAVTDIEPRIFMSFRSKHFLDESEASIGQWLDADARKILKFYFGVLNQELSSRPYLMGTEFMLADLFLSVVCSPFRGDALLTEHAALNAYVEKNLSRPAYRCAFAVNGEAQIPQEYPAQL